MDEVGEVGEPKGPAGIALNEAAMRNTSGRTIAQPRALRLSVLKPAGDRLGGAQVRSPDWCSAIPRSDDRG
jgi:hypothetical protein